MAVHLGRSASGLAGMEGGEQQPGAWAEQTGRRATSSICGDAAARGRRAGPGVLSVPARGGVWREAVVLWGAGAVLGAPPPRQL